ncbi:LysR substrate-binding domain-containing protein [Pseudooceanicola pacificus]|nr:LysR substrate-binding domain-containing protein [Pseudooceanicola pacificus]
MNQKQLNAFRMVMRHGTITAASRAMNVSQPAVSRMLADLEASIGFPLLHRPGGKAVPTREAYEFFQEVERMFYGLDRLGQVAEDIRALNRAFCRVASMPMVSFELLPQTLKRIVTEHPGIDISHDVHTSPRILDLLASRQIDLGIAQTDPGRKDVEVLAAYRTNCVCVMSPKHRLASRREIRPGDLDGEPMVALNFRTLTYTYLMRCFAEAGVAPKIVTETQPSYSACALAALDVGIAVVDPITPGIFGDRVRVVPFSPSVPFDYQVLKPTGTPMSRAATEFFNLFQETIASQPHFGEQVHNKTA